MVATSKRAALALGLGAILAVAAVPAPALASQFHRISYADDRGVHSAGSGFDTGVSDPRRMELRVRVHPDKKIKIHYQVACRAKGEQGEVINEDLKTRSDVIGLPIKVENATGCLVYMFATYRNPDFNREVRFRVSLWARS